MMRASVTAGVEFAVISTEVQFDTQSRYLTSSATFSGRNSDLPPDAKTGVSVADPSREEWRSGPSVRLVTNCVERLRQRIPN